MNFMVKEYAEPIHFPPLKRAELTCTLDDRDVLVAEYEDGTIDISFKKNEGTYVALDKERTDALIAALQELRERFV